MGVMEKYFHLTKGAGLGGIKIPKVKDPSKGKPNLILKPNHYQYKRVFRMLWNSSANGTAIRNKKGEYVSTWK